MTTIATWERRRKDVAPIAFHGNGFSLNFPLLLRDQRLGTYLLRSICADSIHSIRLEVPTSYLT